MKTQFKKVVEIPGWKQRKASDELWREYASDVRREDRREIAVSRMETNGFKYLRITFTFMAEDSSK